MPSNTNLLMLLIDKTQLQSRLIVTVSENTTVVDPVYILILFSEYTNKTFTYPLPANTSAFTDRYDEFYITLNVDPGVYTYTINELTDGIVEQGLCKVIDATSEDYNEGIISITPPETQDDLIFYKG